MPSSTHLPVLLTQCFEPLCLHSGPLGHLLAGYPTRYVLEVSPHENTAVIAATVKSLQSRPSLDVFAASVVCRGSGVASGGVWYPPNASLPIPGEEDESVPLCDTHATLSTEAGLHAQFKAHPPLESAGALIRSAMGASNRVKPGHSTLLVLAVEAADHLFEEEEEEEASPVAPLLKTLCEWSQCHECWAKATGGGGPSAALILTATHAPAIPSSVWALPGKAPNLFLPPHTLNSLTKALGSEGTGEKEGGSSSKIDDGLQKIDHTIAGRGVANTLPFLHRVAQKKEGWGGVRGRGDDGSGGNQGPLSLDIWMSLPFNHPSSTTINTAAQEEEGSTAAIAATQSPSSSPQPPPPSPMHQNSINWGEFVGFPALKNALLRSVIAPMLRSTQREEDGEVKGGGGVGGGMPSGVLIHGPTGCGKTALACAIASAAGAALLHVSCPRLLSKYVGDSEAGIRMVFKAARAASPCVLLLDDLDAIAGSRGGGGSGGGLLNSLVATLLTEMEGVTSGGSSGSGSGSSSTPILVIATCTATAPAAPPPPPPPSFPTFTGMGDTAQKKVEGGDMRGSVGVGGGGSGGGGVSLDAALLRPGRLEVHIAMPLPDTQDRLCILGASPLLPHLNPPLSLQQQGQGQVQEQDQGYSVEELAGDLTAGWSCAQVSALLGEAAMVACLESEEEREGEEVEGGDARAVSPFSAILKPHLDQAMVALCKQSHLPNHYSRA